MRIEDYLNEHMILKIGITLPGYISCEIIVDNPKELVSVVRENGCYISEILWWERTNINTRPIIGHGGTRDPRDPENYFFAETDINKHFSSPLQDADYHRYFDMIKREYSNCDLYPGFDIKKRSRELKL